MYAWLWLALVLAAFAATNVAGSLVASGAWHAMRPRLSRLPARRRAGFLFGLRLFPAAVALFVSVVLVTPAYLLYEPADARETPGLLLLALAVTGTLLIASSIRMAIGIGLATRRFLRERLPWARPLTLTGAPATPLAVGSAFPAISLVGLSQPRLLVAAPVLAALRDDELSAVLAHEAGHLAARDNLKGLILRTAPFWGGSSTPIERVWREASEQAADDYAVAGCADRALSLATALIKVAQMAPQRAESHLLATAFEGGEDVGGRVNRLLDLARRDDPLGALAAAEGRRIWPLAFALTVASALPFLLPRVHVALELVVRHLP